ncbi:hypothetical protein BB561_003718 [Smittium simulii]|uniref:Sulfite efflux pump SSU1 n=1 Tax=Smittium simulii TaxID=133385 RepID=A0A2T9YJY3_9FUNG|nr:hypothetical protein BB561_003718 [Smittium simulii]
MTKTLRHIIQHFVPAWFTVTMGTGILGISIYNLPYQFSGCKVIGFSIFVLNCVLFSLFSLITIAKYLMHPGSLHNTLCHPAQSMFLGAIPMGFATIVNSIVLMSPINSHAYVPTLALVLWYIDVVLMLLSVFAVSFYMAIVHKHSFDTMFATWLLPLVPAVVTAASGALVASIQPPSTAKLVIILSYIIWGIGVPLSCCVITIYFARLAFNSLPPPEIIISSILPLGPMGQGAFGIINLGNIAHNLSKNSSNEAYRIFGESAFGAGILIGLIMWGFAVFWISTAAVYIAMTFKKTPFKFNLGWWGLTFPIGVFISATDSLAKYLQSSAFRVIGTALTLFLTLFWLLDIYLTFINALNLSLFVDPSAKNRALLSDPQLDHQSRS